MEEDNKIQQVEDKNTENKYYGFFNILKTQLLKILNDFTRELDLSFEYINKDVLNVLTKRIKSCENNDIKFKSLYTDILSHLDSYKSQLQIANKDKVRTHELDFLNDIVLLGCSFKVFSDEKKNTKKTLVNYLHEFYTVSSFLNIVNNDNVNDDSIFNTIQNMVEQLTLKSELQPQEISSKTNNTKKNKNNDLGNLAGLSDLSCLSGLGGLGDIDMEGFDKIKETPLFSQFNELMQNKDIMNLANELTSEIQMNDIDPLTIMSSLMSGNLQDNKLNNLINTIGGKITQKINDGDIDKDMLENHANKFINKDDLMSLVANNMKK